MNFVKVLIPPCGVLEIFYRVLRGQKKQELSSSMQISGLPKRGYGLYVGGISDYEEDCGISQA